MESKGGGRRVLLLQCDSGDVHAELIACARYNIWNEFCQMSTDIDTIGRQLLHVIFIVQLPRIAGGCFVGFQVKRTYEYVYCAITLIFEILLIYFLNILVPNSN